MATRVLIVSDEPARQATASDAFARPFLDWEFNRLQTGVEALLHLKDHPCEVVIVDFRKPQTAGAQLLNEVSRLFPTPLRVITGELTDREMISQFVAAPHHFIPKPLQPETLGTELARALALNRWLASEQMRALVSRVQTLPSVPSRYLEVLKELRVEDPSATRLGEIIGSDMAMFTKILQVLNSPFYALARQVTDPTEAVTMLGFEMIKSLVLSIQVFSQFNATKLPVATVDAIWRHSTRVAQAARKIAEFEKADRQLVDNAYMAGLLHDIGKLILISDFADKYRDTLALSRQNGEPIPMSEKQIFGVTHGEISAYLLVTWGMPLALGEAVAYHHHPSRGEDCEFSALSAVHAGDVLVREIDPEHSEIMHLPLDEQYLAKINLHDRAEVWRELLDGKPVVKPSPALTNPVSTPSEPALNLSPRTPDTQPEENTATLVKDVVRRFAFWKK